ncbi:MAG: apolipoprotein N-acyltransferase [Acidobacteria bacterium]|nr:apolipoprotein N-acyltransferase [Acidobacteriota bacterium]
MAAASGILLVALFPRFNLTYFAPLALVPLLLAIDIEPRSGGRFLLGAVAGWIFWGGTCYWIYGVMHQYGHVPASGAAALFAGFFLVKGLHLGLFAWLAGGLLRRAWAIPAVAAVWVAVEGTHSYAGFTWLMLGSAATNMSVLARLAPFTGVVGMSFALLLMNVAVALALRRRPKHHLAWLLLLPLLYLLPPLPEPRTGDRVALLLQPNISEEEIFSNTWTRERTEELLARLALLSHSRVEAGERPDLIIWPENPAPFYFYTDPLFRSTAQNIARAEKTYFLFGTVAFRDAQEREPLNSAVLLGPQGEEIARYDKIDLVPFGEFVPWPLGSLVEKVTREAGDFVPGDKVVVAGAGPGRIGTFICYEAAMGRAVRKFAAGGAEVLVNISNDGWFGRSAAREQHLLIARMRAIENGRWLLRATNTGLTAAIDPAGRVTALLPPDRPGELAARFDYRPATTLYTRWGDWFWWLTIAATAAAKILERLR